METALAYFCKQIQSNLAVIQSNLAVTGWYVEDRKSTIDIFNI